MARTFLLLAVIVITVYHEVQAKSAVLLTPEQVIEAEVECLDYDNYISYSQLWTKSMQNAVLRSNRYNIKSAVLAGKKQIPLHVAAAYLPKLSKHISRFDTERVQVWYIAIDYKVKKESIYQLNGTNYFLQVFVKERGEWKIAESRIAPTDRLAAAGYGFETEEERTYLQRRLDVKRTFR